VVESLKLREGEVHTISGRETLRIRDRIVPSALARVFGCRDEGPEVREYAVIIGRGDKRVGVVVNRLRGQQEVVIKALDPAVSGEAVGMAGRTIMGDGAWC
jgi:two-component system chemotaxis sensor kinase CheA